MSTGATIAYHLRDKKAIERNLFIDLLRRMERFQEINFPEYRYVGFGAAFLEDFKHIHTSLDIVDMDCIEGDEHASSRQKFNLPFPFINLYPGYSTKYITSPDFKQNKKQIIWLDYVSPGQLRDQLNDLYYTGQKVSELDIIKFTFNAEFNSFKSSHRDNKDKSIRFKPLDFILDYLSNDPTYKIYLPDEFKIEHLEESLFPTLLRSMGFRAIKRGLTEINSEFDFFPLTAFEYADGQKMTTVTGIIITKEKAQHLLKITGLEGWNFILPFDGNELLTAHEIKVPSMSILERLEIDKFLPENNVDIISKKLGFFYGTSKEEHKELLQGYCKYYKYLPYFAKVTY